MSFYRSFYRTFARSLYRSFYGSDSLPPGTLPPGTLTYQSRALTFGGRYLTYNS